ncbi:MAG: helix-turn-helix transcriptional regulator [Nocardioides sp.]|uniref:helix-turn-helix domain-containing protein n=1 Tax=Nocardioides sp. TaxID=35761 RepID=UPI0039E6D76C
MPSSPPPAAYFAAAATLGRRVHERRRDLGLTQEQLAERTGISRNQIQNIENNRNNSRDPQTGQPGPGNARLDTIFRLAAALSVDVSYLIGGDNG